MDRPEPALSVAAPAAGWRPRWPARGALAAALLAAGAALVVWLAVPSQAPPRPLERAALAVLPFERVASAGLPDWLGPGLAAGLVEDLSNVPGLPVIAYGSVDAFRDRHPDPVTVGRELKAAYVMQGELRQMPEQIVVTLRLLETRRGTQVWSEQVAGPRAALAELQRNLARSVARSFGDDLQAQPGTATQARASRGVAHELTLQGWVHLQRRTPAELQRARELFRHALAQDDGEARAWLGLAQSLVSAQVLRWPSSGGADIGQAEMALARAQALAPTLTHVRGTAGAIQVMRGRWQDGRRLLESELASHPANVSAHQWLAWTLLQLGEEARAVAEADKALALSPLDPERSGIETVRALGLLQSGQPHQAIVAARRATAVTPRHRLASATLAAALQIEGETEEARAAMQEFLRRAPGVTLAQLLVQDARLPRELQRKRQPVYEAMVAAGLPRK